MKRDLDGLISREFDMLVVGGGIYGACVAREGALRGLDVALIEQYDFSSATSHNSGKIVHGGIRYLQHLDFPRIRESVMELGIWLSIAPHLVKPMKFIMPTQGYLARGPVALLAGIVLHHLIATGTQRRVPDSLKTKIGGLSRKKTLHELLPGLPMERITGAASWFDGQLVDADRVVLECVMAAVEAGSAAANHVCAESLLRDNGTVVGVRAIDAIENRKLEIHARTTVVTGGPWAREFLGKTLGSDARSMAPSLAKNMNIVVPRLLGDYGVGLPSQRHSDAVIGSESRLYFFAPWKDVTIIGTTHFPYDGDPDSYEPDDDEIQSFLDELNSAYPPAALELEDVQYVYSGLTPSDPDSVRGEVGRSKRAEIIDHSRTGDADGLVTVIGVKYTTARLIAERVLDMVERKRGARTGPRRSRTELLPGARGLSDKDKEIAKDDWGANPIADLLYPYGSRLPSGCDSSAQTYLEVFEKIVRHSICAEMAITLDDVLLRRLDLVERGLMTNELLDVTTRIFEKEFGWPPAYADEQRKRFRAKVRYLSEPVGDFS